METENLLSETFKFHGHICWASAIGARAGVVALRALGVSRTGTSGELHLLIEIGDDHGAQCFADGVQYSTGCTFGKGNIEKTGFGKLAITLIDKNEERAVRVSYKPGRHQMIAESSFMKKRGAGVPPTQIPQEEAWEMVNILWEAPESEVLTVGEVEPFPYENFGEVMGLIPCASCGEMVSKKYLRVVGDKHMCIPCSGYNG